MKKMKRIIALLLVLLMLPLPAWADDDIDRTGVTHIARASVALKVRRAPDLDAAGCDSLPRHSYVYILEYGDEWCKVRTQYVEGYIRSQYLYDITPQNGAPEVSPAANEEALPEGLPTFTTSKSTFYEGYIAHTVRATAIFEQPTRDSKKVRDVAIYEQLTVSENSGGWSLVRYKDSYYGYIQTDHLFKWDRIDPYIGEIPGQDIWPYLAFVNHSTTIYDQNTGEELKTINPGAAICVGEKDAFGRYPLPYHRTTGVINEDEIAYLMPVVDWQEAESGDLIAVMTTYFAVGIHTLMYQGRNWNMRLAGTYINGTVLQPGQEYVQNDVIGPYRKSTGYKEAPIMDDEVLSGYGGGTCQVNTTFYIATIQLPLLVKHRLVHADVGMYYAKQGFDAAVGSGAINLIMENTLPYAIRYQNFISDGVLTCCIFKE